MNKIFIIIIAIFSIQLFTGATWLPLFTSSGGGTVGKILLSDAASLILQTDGASKICLAGGCPVSNNLLVSGGTFKILLFDGLSKICLAGGC